MIVRQTTQGWDIIYQSAHALLAAQLISHWQAGQRPARWVETLTATAQHDNGWQEWEGGAQRTDDGAPRDFTKVPAGDIVLQAERVVTRARHQSRWVGLLVARHVRQLNAQSDAPQEALAVLLRDQRRLARSWQEGLGVSDRELEEAYALLWWGDTFSLHLCRGTLSPDGRMTAIAPGPDGQPYHAALAGDNQVAFTPWPYDANSFTVSVDVHHLHERSFDSDEALAAALRAAPVTAQIWTVAPASQETSKARYGDS